MNVSDFRALLTGDAGVSALVAGRVFPLIIPQEVWDSATRKPCIIYTVNGVQRSRRFCGTEALLSTSVDVDCVSRTYDACINLANAVRSAITDFRGLQGATLFGPIFVETELDLHEPDPGLFRRTLTLTVWSAPA